MQRQTRRCWPTRQRWTNKANLDAKATVEKEKTSNKAKAVKDAKAVADVDAAAAAAATYVYIIDGSLLFTAIATPDDFTPAMQVGSKQRSPSRW